MKHLFCALNVFVVWAAMSPVMGMEFDAKGRRLDPDPEPQRQYQWTDPATGKVVTKPYPPANLIMRQTGRSNDGMTIYLTAEGKSKFEDAINMNTPKSAQSSAQNGGDSDLAARCLDFVRQEVGYKDPDSLKTEGSPAIGFTTVTGEVRKRVSINVNGKNSYGAYAGAKPVTCVIGADGKVITSH